MATVSSQDECDQLIEEFKKHNVWNKLVDLAREYDRNTPQLSVRAAILKALDDLPNPDPRNDPYSLEDIYNFIEIKITELGNARIQPSTSSPVKR